MDHRMMDRQAEDQQLDRKQLTEGRPETRSPHDGCSSVAERLRRLGRDGYSHAEQPETRPHESSAQPIEAIEEEREEEFLSLEDWDFRDPGRPEDLTGVAAANARRRDDNVKIDASQIPFFAQMRDFLHRNSTWLLIAALILLVLQDVLGTHGVLAMRRSQKEAAQVQKEIQQLSEENQHLQNRVQSLKSDPATIERIAREEMGLARPGEYIFKLQPKPGEPSTPLAQPAEPPKKP